MKFELKLFPLLHSSYNFKIQAQAHPKPIRFLKIPAQPRPIGGPAHGPWVGPAHDEHWSNQGGETKGIISDDL